MKRSKHYSVSRMFLREKAESAKFVVIVTDPRNVSTREIIKVSRDITEATLLTHLARAPLELVPRQPIKPPVLPTPRREKKPLIVETVESVAIDKNRSNEASSAKIDKTKSEVIGATRDVKVIEVTRDDKVIETTSDAEVTTDEAAKAESQKVP